MTSFPLETDKPSYIRTLNSDSGHENFYASLFDWKVGEDLTKEQAKLLTTSLIWVNTPQGFGYWQGLYSGQREVGEKDIIAAKELMFDYVKPLNIKDYL